MAAQLVISPRTLVKADAPTKLMVAESVAIQVLRSGKERLIYTVSVCSGPSVIVHEVTKSTGLPDLDHFIDRQLGLFITPPKSGCATVTLVLDFTRSSFHFTERNQSERSDVSEGVQLECPARDGMASRCVVEEELERATRT